jgi:hypothetical protein
MAPRMQHCTTTSALRNPVVTFFPSLASAFPFEAPKRPHQSRTGSLLLARGPGHRSGQGPRAGDALFEIIQRHFFNVSSVSGCSSFF